MVLVYTGHSIVAPPSFFYPTHLIGIFSKAKPGYIFYIFRSQEKFHRFWRLSTNIIWGSSIQKIGKIRELLDVLIATRIQIQPKSIWWTNTVEVKLINTVISASDDRYQDQCDEAGLSTVRLQRMPELKAAEGSMCTKANYKETRINTVIWSRFQDFRT